MSQSPEPLLICVAWPYANNRQHLGHYAGCHLPADVFARYQRLMGRDVVMVSGSDVHGSPVGIAAEKEGCSPKELAERYHKSCVESHRRMGITFDLFTTTHTQNHRQVAQEMFLKLKDNGYIYLDKSDQLYDKSTGQFLADRYVEGKCPFCKSDGARGDQCDSCGKTYDAIDLVNPVSKLNGSKDIEVRATEHFYFDLGKLNEPLIDWIEEDKNHWRPHVLNHSRSELGKRELRGRPITRDLSWGVPVPLEGFESKCMYVWFEAVMGYLSATKEWAASQGKDWQKWWQPEEGRSYYCLGKDNISFHTQLWPAMLMGVEGMRLPHDVPANEYLNSYGRKLSKSTGTAIFALDALENYQPDAVRYVLCALAPETSDVDFTWDDFVEKVNNELLANWGNLANRVLGFAWKRFEGKVSHKGTLLPEDTQLLEEVQAGFSSVGELFEAVKLKAALEEVRRLSQKVNQYLNDTAPWKEIKTDAERAATTMYVALQAVQWLNKLWSPILPNTSQMIHETLGGNGHLFGSIEEVIMGEGTDDEHLTLQYDPSQASGHWQPCTLEEGCPMREPERPFVKLDLEEVIAREVPEA